MSNQYKDSLFRSLFNREERLLELYNAIKEASYSPETRITINNLEETLFTRQKNNLSFTISGRVVVPAV
jgi:hypothetical protein